MGNVTAKTFEEKYGISPTGSPVTRDILIDEGIEAADVFPCLSTVTTTFSIGIFSFFAVAEMIL